MSADNLRFAIVAGEASGDILGAALIRALRARFPHATFYGVTGPRMSAAGCDSIASIEQLSVMGLVEVLRHLPRLLKLRSQLFQRFVADRPDCFIGIDAPDFNLPLERKLRARGLRTVHMVSPTVWAWRPKRVRSIVQSTDLMLCLLPFEPQFYADHGGAPNAVTQPPGSDRAGLRAPFRAVFIGHPLAEELDQPVTREIARLQLGLPADAPCVAVLPGSRGSELKYLGRSFAAAGGWLSQHVEGVALVVPIAKPSLRPLFEQAIAELAPTARWWLVDGRSREAMRAADVVLLASGTAALECLLLDRPMVASYRASSLTAWLLRRMVRVKHVTLPNLLCRDPVVPELLQEQAQPELLGKAVLDLLREPAHRQRQLGQFGEVRQQLKQNAGARAAAAIAELLQR